AKGAGQEAARFRSREALPGAKYITTQAPAVARGEAAPAAKPHPRSGLRAERLHHARAHRGLVCAGGRREFGEREAAPQRILLVQPVEGDEVGVHQHRAGGVLAVVDERIAVAVEYLGGARLAYARPRTH